MFASLLPDTVVWRGSPRPSATLLSDLGCQLAVVTFVRGGVEKATWAVRAIDALVTKCHNLALSAHTVPAADGDGVDRKEGDGGGSYPVIQVVVDMGEEEEAWTLPADLRSSPDCGTCTLPRVSGGASCASAPAPAAQRLQWAAGLSVAAVVPEVVVFHVHSGEPWLAPADALILAGRLTPTATPVTAWPRNCFRAVDPATTASTPAPTAASLTCMPSHSIALHHDALIAAFLYPGDPVLVRRVGAAAVAATGRGGAAPTLHSVPAIVNPSTSTDSEGEEEAEAGSRLPTASPPAPAVDEVWVPPALLRSLGCTPGNTLSITAQMEDEAGATAGGKQSITLVVDVAAACDAMGIASATAAMDALVPLVQAHFGVANVHLASAVHAHPPTAAPTTASGMVPTDTIAAAVAAADLSLTPAQLAMLASHVRQGRCRHIPVVQGQFITLTPRPHAAHHGGEGVVSAAPTVDVVVASTEPRHRVITVTPHTSVVIARG